MASAKTQLTELGTAIGLVHDPATTLPEQLPELDIPGIPAELWQPVVMPAAATAGADRDLLGQAVGNGRAFRHLVLGGRRPERIAWTANQRSTWLSDVPRDLTVDSVYFIQAKYNSRCVLNTSPANLVEELLAGEDNTRRDSWYEDVALAELDTYYRRVRDLVAGAGPGTLTHASASGEFSDLPTDVRDLQRSQRVALGRALRGTPPDPGVEEAYSELCAAVSTETARRWRRRLRGASVPRQTQMLFRMLRIAGGPYWLLGTERSNPVQLGVSDTLNWRERYELRSFTVTAGRGGQPLVNWRAVIRDRREGTEHPVEGICEIRWTHGKLAGNPECKVQVTTPLGSIPGYSPLPHSHPW